MVLFGRCLGLLSVLSCSIQCNSFNDPESSCIEDLPSMIGCITLPFDGAGNEMEVQVDLQGSSEYFQEFALQFITSKTNLEPAVLSVLSEHVRRRAALAKFRRNETAEFWAKETSVECVVLHHACATEARVEYRNEMEMECLVFGRGLLDASRREDLAWFFQTRKPVVLVLDGFSASDAKHVMNTFLKRFVHPLGRVVFLKMESNDELFRQLELNGFHPIRNSYGDLVALNGVHENGSGAIVKSLVVNLLQDKAKKYDQLNFEKAKRAGLFLERFDAIDGRLYALKTRAMKQLFGVNASNFENPYEDHGWRGGVIGCSLSNLVIWAEMTLNNDLGDLDAYLFLEDDVLFADDFEGRWRREIIGSGVLQDPRWDLLYLGFTDDTTIHRPVNVFPNIGAFTRRSRSYGGGTFGYILRKRGATALRDLAKREGVSQPIDWFMIEAFSSKGTIVAYKSLIPLVKARYDFGSSTTSSYPWTVESHCKTANPPVQRERNTPLGKLVTGIFGTNDSSSAVPVDAEVKANIEVFENRISLAAFETEYKCSKICYRVDKPLTSNMSEAFDCIFTFDGEVVSLDVGLVELGGTHLIYAGLYDAYGHLVPMEVIPAKISVQQTWIEIQLAPPNELTIQVGPSFRGHHSASLLCIQHNCIHFGALFSEPTTMISILGNSCKSQLDIRVLDVMDSILLEKQVLTPSCITAVNVKLQVI